METVPVTTKLGPPGSSPDVGFFDIDVGPRGPWRAIISPDDLARWLRITGDDNPIYGAIAPPTILYYLSQHMLGRYLIGKTLHATRQGGFARYTTQCLAPIPVGVPLVISGGITDRFARRGRGYVAYDLEARAGDTVVQRHQKLWSFGLTDDEAASLPERPSESRADLHGELTERLGPLSLTLTIDRLADLEGPGEHNGHTDVEMARTQGRSGPLAQGVLAYSLISRLLTDRHGMDYLRGGTLDVRFLSPVYAPEQIHATAEVMADGITVQVTNDAGALAVAGTATV